MGSPLEGIFLICKIRFFNVGQTEGGGSMKDDLVDLLKKILQTNVNLDFLSDLEQKDLETLIAVIRDRIDQEKRTYSPRR